MAKKKSDTTPENTQVHMVNAPHQIAIMIDDVVQDLTGAPKRLAMILLSEPTFAYFNGSTLPTDPEGRNVIGQTYLDSETNEWVHTDMDGTERREPVNPSPWEQSEDA